MDYERRAWDPRTASPAQTFNKPWHAATNAVIDHVRLTTYDRAAMLRTLTNIRTLPEN